MKKLGEHLTYANVISTLCLFLLLGGGAAFAATKLAKNSVGAKQIKSNAVTTAKIKNGAVTGPKLADGAVTNAKLADGAVTGAKVQDNSLTGADIDQSTLNGVKASNVTKIALAGDEHCTPEIPLPAGISAERTTQGVCVLHFPQALTNCALSATVHLRNLGEVIVLPTIRNAYVYEFASNPGLVRVETVVGKEAIPVNLDVDLIVVC